MSWNREALFTKAKLYFEKAFEEDKNNSFFGLWCAMGLELLARSAISSVSPTLLADPDPTHQNLLHALGHGSSKSKKKSLMMIHVLTLCQTLIKDFTDYHFKVVASIVNQRNEELHTGASAFEEYSTSQWIAGFYKCCKILSEFQGESLNTLMGEDVRKEADIILIEMEEEVVGKTKSLIAAHSKVFDAKAGEHKEKLKEESETNSNQLAYIGHHKLTCPSCGSLATVFGEPFGNERIETKEGVIITRQSILPTKFRCIACDLKLDGYNALKAADLAGHYTRKTSYRPEEYYNIGEEDIDIDWDEYNND